MTEDEAYVAQEKYIREHHTDEDADQANYGWFIDEVDGYVTTKVYGIGILTTNLRTNHTWMEGFDGDTEQTSR